MVFGIRYLVLGIRYWVFGIWRVFVGAKERSGSLL